MEAEIGRKEVDRQVFGHGLQDGYLSFNPHVKGGPFPLSQPMLHLGIPGGPKKKRSELWRPISQIRVQITSQNFHQVCVTSLRIGMPNYNTVPLFSSQQSYVE